MTPKRETMRSAAPGAKACRAASAQTKCAAGQRAGTGRGDHRLRHVDTDTVRPAAQRLGQRQRGGAGAAADVDHAARGARPCRLDQPFRKGREQRIEQRLRLHPGVSGRTVPQRCLRVALHR